jgi:hypothetical protein
MPSYAQSTPQQEQTTPSPETSTPTQTTPAGGGGGGGGGNPTARRGGQNHIVVRGDTLWRIAERTYGHGRYWTEIRDANPERVFRGGDLILVGAELILPMVEVPDTSGAGTGTETTAGTGGAPPAPGGGAGAEGPGLTPPVEEGGESPAIQPVGQCTEFGDFLVYPDDYQGPLPATGDDGQEHIRQSDLAPLLAERRAAAEAERNQAVTSVQELLSYDWNDWAITDAEATQALNLLGGLHITQIGTAIGQIGQTNIDRLLDNLPASARQSQAFGKVVVAMGPARARPYIQELLSYGLFDWAVTDGDITAAMVIINQLPPAEQAEVITGMDLRFQVRFATNLHPGAGVSNELLQRLFDAMPDTELGALKALLGARFGFEVGERESGSWDAAGLRQAWVVLAPLPPGHVRDNEMLDLFLSGGSADGSGYYRGSDDSAVIEYSDITKQGSYGGIMVDDGAGGQTDVGLHSNVNLFNTVVRHEIGHAVDAQMGASGPGGYCESAANAGQWKQYGSADAFADAIIASGGGMGQYAHPDEYEQALRKAIKDEVSFVDALNDLKDDWFFGVDDSVPDPGLAAGGPIAAVYNLNAWHNAASPWYNQGNRVVAGDRYFHQAYGGSRYVSYVADTRARYGISAYQFRAPGEWFAEAYACYYSDHQSANGQAPGTRLRTRDAAAASWFDANVDQGHSLPTETNQTGGGGGGGGGGSSSGMGTEGTAPAGT